MATTMTKPDTETTSATSKTGADKGRLRATATMVSDAAGAAANAAGTAVGAAGDAATRLPDLADRGRLAFEDANRRVQAGTDERLTLGTAVGFGFAVGLLIGGASRLLVAAAFVPVAMMGLTLLDRIAQGRLNLKTPPSAAGSR
jgi:hypothetical protein